MASAVGYLVGLPVAVKRVMCVDCADNSDCDVTLSESRSKARLASDVAGDSDEEVAQVPPAKKSGSKPASQQQPVFMWTDASIQPQVHQYTGVSDQMSSVRMERELLNAILILLK